MRARSVSIGLTLASLVFTVACGGGGTTSPGKAAFADTTLAGAATSGTTDGDTSVARFNNPTNVAADPDGITVYVCDFDNNRVRRIVGSTVSTLVNQANFSRPFGIAVSGSALYVSTDDDDSLNHSPSTGTIWKVDKVTGVATVIARDIGRPRGLALLADGTIVASNLSRNVVSLINPTTGAETVIAGEDGVSGFSDGTGTAAHFNRAYGCTVTGSGDILVADQGNNCIRKVTTAGVVTTFAGTGTAGHLDSAYASAQFQGPQDVKYDPNFGMIYVADTTGKYIRRLNSGMVETIAGNGVAGFAQGAGTANSYYGLEGIGIAPNGRTLLIADGNGGNGTDYNRVRSLTL